MNASSSRAVTIYLAGLCLFCAVAGASLCWLNPARTWASVLAMAFLPLAWGLLAAIQHRRSHGDGRSGDRLGLPPEWLRSLALAGTMQSASLLAVLLSHLGLAPDLAEGMRERSGGFLLGLLVVVLSNTVPKQFANARRQQVLRRSGWALVLGGMAYSASWLFLPLSMAGDIALWALMAAVIFALAQFMRSGGSCTPLKPTAQG